MAGILLLPSHISNQSLQSSINPLESLKTSKESSEQVEESLPNIKWKHVAPCSKFLNEKEEWNKAIQCSSSVFSQQEIETLKHTSPPECYVILETSPGVFKSKQNNYIPLPIGGNFGAVVGLYSERPELKDHKKVFLVENYDINMVYRHEAQHYMFTVLDRRKEDEGARVHTHKIWSECETAYYEASEGAKKHYSDRDLSKADVVMSNLIKLGHMVAPKPKSPWLPK